MKFLENNVIQVDPPKRPKKLTATRFAAILGYNKWATPFSAWCEMTRTYEEPFVDSIYTIAGKVIEPKICDYLRDRYFMDIKSPTDVYGPDYFKKTWGDFFPDVEALGGMWDFLGDDFVVEVKTTKRAEDWRNADGEIDPPIYYKLQAALYAYLLGFDNIVMTCSFLGDQDYEKPEEFVPDISNTIIAELKLSEEFPCFEQMVEEAYAFWNTHVLTGISPAYDDRRDAEIIKALKKSVIEVDDENVKKLIKEADKLKLQIDKADARLTDKRKRLKELDDEIKKYMISQFRETDDHVDLPGVSFSWSVGLSSSQTFDWKKLEKENPEIWQQVAKYLKSSPKYTLRKSEISDS